MEWLGYLAYGDTGWGDELLSGLVVTLSLAFCALPLGLGLGITVATAAMAKHSLPKRLALVFTTVIRGLPELLTLFIIYHGVGLLLNKGVNAVWPDFGYIEFSPFIAGTIALGLVFAGYSAEVFRGAWLATDKGQREAALALGLKKGLVFRLVELPQITRLALPGLGNLWINLVKDTALVSIIALDDLMRMANVAVGSTKKPFVFFLTVCLMYWLVCMVFEWCIAKLEHRANRGIQSF